MNQCKRKLSQHIDISSLPTNGSEGWGFCIFKCSCGYETDHEWGPLMREALVHVHTKKPELAAMYKVMQPQQL